ncbi:hypothetical protein ACQPVP_00235 [Clostridium nigeriense]|uniref:hypothetical protein n=1 Tax=Clostridium nigeriense TaxID=1805470 RepID=UPI003D33D273
MPLLSISPIPAITHITSSTPKCPFSTPVAGNFPPLLGVLFESLGFSVPLPFPDSFSLPLPLFPLPLFPDPPFPSPLAIKSFIAVSKNFVASFTSF